MDEKFDTDDISGPYLESRQISQELNSPAILALSKYGGDDIPVRQAHGHEQGRMAEIPSVPEDKSKEFEADLRKRGKTEEQIRRIMVPEIEADPWIDPSPALGGGFGFVAKMGVSQGMKLLPTFGRALLAGTTAGLEEIPVGAATEKLARKFPFLALPFNLLFGMAAGASIDKIIMKSVTKAMSKQGINTRDVPGLVKKNVETVRANLEAGKIEDELTGAAVEGLNKKYGKLAEKLSPEEMTKKIDEAARPGIEKRLTEILGDSERPLVELAKETAPKAPIFLQSNIADLPEKAININFARLNTSDEVQEAIAKTADLFSPGIQAARRGKISNEETEKLADLLGMTAPTLLKRRKGEAFNAEQAIGARRMLVSSAEHLVGLSKKAAAIDASDLDKFEFQKHLNLHYAIQAQVSGMTAEAGRALQAFNIKVSSVEGQTKAIKDLLGHMPSDISSEKVAMAVSTIDTVEGINAFSRQVRRATTGDMFLEAWINGLLTGPQTHAVNTLSNSLVAVWQVPERSLAAQFSKITPGPRAIQDKEALWQAFGLIEGIKDGFRLAGKALRTGMPSDDLSKIEVNRFRAITAENVRETVAGQLMRKISPNALEQGGIGAWAVNLMGEVVRGAGRLLVTEDEFFKGIGYRMELRARAFRTAFDEGLEGTNMARRIQEIMQNPEQVAPDLHMAAMEAKNYQTFTKALGEAGKKGQQVLSHVPVLRLVVPFVRTPTNILKFAGERTPLAFISKNIRADIAAGGARRDLALARVSMGSMVMAGASIMAAAGNITGGGPSDPKMKAHLYNTGWQAYSFKINDKYYSYGRLEPIGMLLGLAADTTEIMGQLDEMDAGDLAAATVMAISKNVTSKTWMRGISEMMRTFDDPDRYGGRYLQNYLKSLIPTGVAQIERAMSPEMEAVYGYMDALKSRIPGYSDELPPRRNIWGEPIVLSGGLGPDIMSPVYMSEKKYSPIDEEMLRLKRPISMPKRKMSLEGISIELTPHEYSYFMVLMNDIKLDSTGKVLKTSLNELLRDPEYKNASDENKYVRIRERIEEARELAKRRLLDESGGLRDLVDYGHKKQAMGEY